MTKLSSSLALILGITVGAGGTALSQDDTRTLVRSMLGGVEVTRVDLYTSTGIAELHVRAEPVAEVQALGVAPRGWIERAHCPAAAVEAFIEACAARDTTARPPVLFEEGEGATRLEAADGGYIAVPVDGGG